MANIRELVVVGRYRSGNRIIAYHVQDVASGKSKRVEKEQFAYYVGKGQIKNCKGQLYKDKVIYTGEGCSLDNLPTKTVSEPVKQATPVTSASGQTTTTPSQRVPQAAQPQRASNQVTITARIVKIDDERPNLNNIWGYRIQSLDGTKTKDINKESVLDLAKTNRISNAKLVVQNGISGLTGVGVKLRELPLIYLDERGKRLTKSQAEKKASTIRQETAMASVVSNSRDNITLALKIYVDGKFWGYRATNADCEIKDLSREDVMAEAKRNNITNARYTRLADGREGISGVGVNLKNLPTLNLGSKHEVEIVAIAEFKYPSSFYGYKLRKLSNNTFEIASESTTLGHYRNGLLKNAEIELDPSGREYLVGKGIDLKTLPVVYVDNNGKEIKNNSGNVASGIDKRTKDLVISKFKDSLGRMHTEGNKIFIALENIDETQKAGTNEIEFLRVRPRMPAEENINNKRFVVAVNAEGNITVYHRDIDTDEGIETNAVIRNMKITDSNIYKLTLEMNKRLKYIACQYYAKRFFEGFKYPIYYLVKDGKIQDFNLIGDKYVHNLLAHSLIEVPSNNTRYLGFKLEVNEDFKFQLEIIKGDNKSKAKIVEEVVYDSIFSTGDTQKAQNLVKREVSEFYKRGNLSQNNKLINNN